MKKLKVVIKGYEYWFEHRVLGGLPVIVAYCENDGVPDSISLFTRRGKPAAWAEDRLSSVQWLELIDACQTHMEEEHASDEGDKGDYLYEQWKDKRMGL